MKTARLSISVLGIGLILGLAVNSLLVQPLSESFQMDPLNISLITATVLLIGAQFLKKSLR